MFLNVFVLVLIFIKFTHVLSSSQQAGCENLLHPLLPSLFTPRQPRLPILGYNCYFTSISLMACLVAIKVTVSEIQSGSSDLSLLTHGIHNCMWHCRNIWWAYSSETVLLYFCFNLNSAILLMCPNVAFGKAQSHSWFILIDDLINCPISFSILRAAKSRFTHLVLT